MDLTLSLLLLVLGLVLGAGIGFWLARRMSGDGQAALKDTFQALSADVLAKNTEQFLQLAQTRFEALQAAGKGELELSKKSMEILVQPLKEQLERLQQHNKELEQSRHSAYVGITEQVKHLMAGQEKLTSETGRALLRERRRQPWPRPWIQVGPQ